jgi:hypothetical protein
MQDELLFILITLMADLDNTASKLNLLHVCMVHRQNNHMGKAQTEPDLLMLK